MQFCGHVFPQEIANHVKYYFSPAEFGVLHFAGFETYVAEQSRKSPDVWTWRMAIQAINIDSAELLKRIVPVKWKIWLRKKFTYRGDIYANALYFLRIRAKTSNAINCLRWLDDFFAEQGLYKNSHKKRLVRNLHIYTTPSDGDNTDATTADADDNDPDNHDFTSHNL